ncbi:MAG TPA: type II secretion system F family protein [Gemmataceae bacterium]|nr:type II secretion system F family protein [Gemmataceae bacterium]
MLFAAIDFTFLIPLAVFVGFVGAVWAVLSMISNRNSRAQERLVRLSRPQSLADIDDKMPKKERFQGVMETAKALSGPLMPGTELEQSALKTKLANAGFRSDSAIAVYLGMRFASLLVFFLISLAYALPHYGMTLGALKWVVGLSGLGFYLPNMILWFIRRKRQEEIFLTLPDALDLLVVCVESGLGLDAAMRKVCEEMKDHAKTICEEFSLANFQLQMGRPRREVLHDLGVRTGVDDVRSLAAILIQADRFGSSIAQALRVQSDSMRTRRKQLAEEKAAKTAVQLIFPLVLFIFPGIFVVLVGPAAINIMQTMLKPQ